MSSRKPLSVAVHRALSGLALASVAMPVLSQAQEDQGPPGDLEEITVTGSRIATDANLISSSPVTQIEAADLTYRGVTRVEDLLNDLPQITPEFSSNDANGASGTATLDLRGLGSDRTLVLVNGHRMGFGDPFVLSPDINQIPGALVDRVEILTGGASSTYGSDAVSGVVNFIMKDDFEGFQLGYQYSGYQHNNGNGAVNQVVIDSGFEPAPGDVTVGGMTDINLLVGINTSDGRGNITAYAGYRDIEAVTQDAYDFTACALNNTSDNSLECGGSSTSAEGRFTDFGVPFFGDVPPGVIAPGFDYTVVGDQFVPGVPLYNYGPLNYFQRPDERFTGGFFGHYDVSDQMEGYAEFMFMDDHTRAQIAPSGAFFVTSTISCDNPFMSPQQRTLICDSDRVLDDPEVAGIAPSSIGIQSCANGAIDPCPLYIGRRNVEGGPRTDDLRHTSFRSLVGVRGDINDNWSYDISGNFSRLAFAETYLNDMSTTRIIRALDVIPDPDTGEAVCRSVVTGVDPACVPWNLFEEGQVTQEAIDYLILPLFSRASMEMNQYVGFVNGDLSDIGLVSPWASDGIEMVLGTEYREEAVDFNPDIGFQTGDGAGQGGPIPPVSGAQDVTEFFTEFRIPLAQDRPGLRDLSLDLRYRYSDYSSGVTADTYNIGGAWVPVEWVKLRGGFSHAVRAPNLRERFEPQSIGLWSGLDPCAGASPELSEAACANAGVSASQYGNIPLSPAQQYNALFGGNPDLNPEEADSITVGAVFTPDEMLPGLTFSVDYWKIEVEDAISAVDPEFTIRQCAATADPTLCGAIHRGNNGNLWVGQTNVLATNINIGFFEVTGIDLVGKYAMEIGEWGSLDLGFRGSILESFDEQPIPGATVN
ncbi:MAG TPA: TonB-dependent receptor, partial [Woeseiaceae bacterium]|nr:TonB-dependent receptor [Woeseiaceae bacterium]